MTLLNKKAPSFKLEDQDGKAHSPKDYLGSFVVLYFYPKDNTPGCTREACAIKENYTKFKKMGVVVIGISGDSIKSHKSFADKYKLPFLLLSDKDKKVLPLYGTDQVGSKRKTYIIDPKGKIVKEYPKVSPDKHALELLLDLKELIK